MMQPRAARALTNLWRLNGLRIAQQVFANVRQEEILTRQFSGAVFPIDVSRSQVHQLLYLEGERFVAERFLIQRLLKPSMRVADIGANIGYYLLLIRQAVGPTGRILSVEPEPDNLIDLRRVVAANGFQNVQVVPVALGAENGEAQLCKGLNGMVVPTGGDVTVPIMRLDDLWSQTLNDRIDFLKVDVEGFEGEVLRGGEHIIAEYRPRMFLEMHPTMIRGPHSVSSIYEMLVGWYGSQDRIQFFEVSSGRVSTQIWAKYFDGDIVRRLETKEILRACETGERRATVWVVCR